MFKKFYLYLFLVSLFALGAAFLSPGQTLAQKDVPNEPHARVCPRSAGKDSADCDSRVIVDNNGQPKVTTLPSGYGPAQFLGAYALGNGSVSTPTTIAIVDAYDHPNIFSDLNTYSSTSSGR